MPYGIVCAGVFTVACPSQEATRSSVRPGTAAASATRAKGPCCCRYSINARARLGPTPGNIEKINDTYRYKLTIKCRNDRRFRDLVRETLGLYEQEKLPAKASVVVDLHSDGDI